MKMIVFFVEKVVFFAFFFICVWEMIWVFMKTIRDFMKMIRVFAKTVCVFSKIIGTFAKMRENKFVCCAKRFA